MDAIVEQVEALAAAADEQTHRKLVDTVRKLLYSIESPEDTNRRLIHGVRSHTFWSAHLSDNLTFVLIYSNFNYPWRELPRIRA
jgi:hypothetical protein